MRRAPRRPDRLRRQRASPREQYMQQEPLDMRRDGMPSCEPIRHGRPACFYRGFLAENFSAREQVLRVALGPRADASKVGLPGPPEALEESAVRVSAFPSRNANTPW